MITFWPKLLCYISKRTVFENETNISESNMESNFKLNVISAENHIIAMLAFNLEDCNR